MSKKVLLLLITLIICVTFCGCSDSTEPENRVIITAIGLDEKNGKLQLSIESADVISNTNEDIYNSHFASVTADNLNSAIRELENCSYGKLLYSQCPIVLIGENLSAKNFLDFLDFCVKEHEVTFSVRLLSCPNAESILNSDNNKDSLIGYEILKLIEYGNISDITEQSDSVPVIFDKIKSNKEFYLPRIELVNSQLKISESKRIEVV